MKNRKFLLGLGIVILLASLSVAAFALQTSAADLLVQSIERLEAAQSGHAVVAFEFDTPEERGSGTMEVWGQLEVGANGEPAGRVEIRESSVAKMVGVTAVSDGTQFWLYHPGENRVIVGTFAEVAAFMAEKAEEHEAALDDTRFDFEGDRPSFDEADLPEFPENAEEAVALVLQYFTAEHAGRAQIGDSRARTVRLIPIPEQMPDEVRAAGGLINVWVRPSDTAPLGGEYTGGAVGSASVQVTTLELDINIDPTLFTFEIPDGAEVIHFSELEAMAREAAESFEPVKFDALTPATLPEGAALRETVNLGGAVVQRYTLADGMSFSVAQGPGETAVPENALTETVTVRGIEATIFTDSEGGRTLLVWSENGLNFWVGGDLTAQQAILIAESLQ